MNEQATAISNNKNNVIDLLKNELEVVKQKLNKNDNFYFFKSRYEELCVEIDGVLSLFPANGVLKLDKERRIRKDIDFCQDSVTGFNRTMESLEDINIARGCVADFISTSSFVKDLYSHQVFNEKSSVEKFQKAYDQMNTEVNNHLKILNDLTSELQENGTSYLLDDEVFEKFRTSISSIISELNGINNNVSMCKITAQEDIIDRMRVKCIANVTEIKKNCDKFDKLYEDPVVKLLDMKPPIDTKSTRRDIDKVSSEVMDYNLDENEFDTKFEFHDKCVLASTIRKDEVSRCLNLLESELKRKKQDEEAKAILKKQLEEEQAIVKKKQLEEEQAIVKKKQLEEEQAIVKKKQLEEEQAIVKKKQQEESLKKQSSLINPTQSSFVDAVDDQSMLRNSELSVKPSMINNQAKQVEFSFDVETEKRFRRIIKSEVRSEDDLKFIKKIENLFKIAKDYQSQHKAVPKEYAVCIKVYEDLVINHTLTKSVVETSQPRIQKEEEEEEEEEEEAEEVEEEEEEEDEPKRKKSKVNVIRTPPILKNSTSGKDGSSKDGSGKRKIKKTARFEEILNAGSNDCDEKISNPEEKESKPKKRSTNEESKRKKKKSSDTEISKQKPTRLNNKDSMSTEAFNQTMQDYTEALAEINKLKDRMDNLESIIEELKEKKKEKF